MGFVWADKDVAYARNGNQTTIHLERKQGRGLCGVNLFYNVSRQRGFIDETTVPLCRKCLNAVKKEAKST